MKALVYNQAHSLDHFAIHLVEIAEPELRDLDVLVEVHAIGINPGETFFRRTRNAEPGGRVLLGYEFAGVIAKAGPDVHSLKMGDRVFGTGDLSRDGAWAQRVAIDHRMVARIPDQLSFADAASLPIGSLTAWEAMFRDQSTLPTGVHHVLIVGGAGGVGSLATQLLKAKTPVFVISTASRPESREWCLKMGADLVLDHTKDIKVQLASHHIEPIDLVLSTANSANNVGWIVEVLRPFGHLCVVDTAPPLDANLFMLRALSLHMEMVFSKALHGWDLQSQGSILEEVTRLVVEGKVHPLTTTRLRGLTAETMHAAHQLIETHQTIGKVVIEC